MREIKFRAWRKRRWLHDWEWGLTANGATLIYDQDEDEWTAQNKECPVYDLSICQFTGLKDKNGKDIYEGDILGGMWGDGWIGYCDKCKSFEYFSVGFGCMGCEGDVCWYEIVNAESEGQLEVIGNIYKNPELLES